MSEIPTFGDILEQNKKLEKEADIPTIGELFGRIQKKTEDLEKKSRLEEQQRRLEEQKRQEWLAKEQRRQWQEQKRRMWQEKEQERLNSAMQQESYQKQKVYNPEKQEKTIYTPFLGNQESFSGKEQQSTTENGSFDSSSFSPTPPKSGVSPQGSFSVVEFLSRKINVSFGILIFIFVIGIIIGIFL